MSKKKRSARFGNRVIPEFQKHIEETMGNVIDLSGAPDEKRMSNNIALLIDPFLAKMETELLLDCATIAWNECLYEDYELKESYFLNNALLNYAKYRDLIDELKARKRIMFHDNRMYIKEAKVYEDGDDFHFNVAYLDIANKKHSKEYEMMNRLKTALAEMIKDSLSEDFTDDEPDDESEEDESDFMPGTITKRVIREAVDNQLRDNDPPIARETFERLQAKGYTAEQAKEKIAGALGENIHDVLQSERPHDEQAYKKRLEALQ